MQKIIVGSPFYVPRPKDNKEKKKLTKNDIDLQFLLADDKGSTYKVSFIIMGADYGTYTKRSLRDAILANISTHDRKYMMIKSFTNKKAIFELNTKKWLGDATRGIKPITRIASFSRSYRLKVRVPDMIVTDILSDVFNKFLLRHFKVWINTRDKREIVKKFKIRNRSRLTSLFDYNYDYQWNTVTISLKFLYRGALLLGIRSTIANRFNKQHTFNFARSVNRNMASFNRYKWKKYVGKKFF